MSAASDTGNDALVQGAGMVDVDAAVGAALGENGGFAVSVPESYAALRGSLGAAVESANATEFGADRFVLPRSGPAPASWFAGMLHAGGRATASVEIRNPSNETLVVAVEPQRLGLVRADAYGAVTEPRVLDADLNGTDLYAPNYIRLADARHHGTVASFLDGSAGLVPAVADLLVLTVRFSIDGFMNASSDEYAGDLSIASLYLYDWDDENGDRTPSSSELSMVSRAGSWGTVQEMRVSNPSSEFDATPLVGVYPVPERYSYWEGATGLDAAPLPYEVSAAYYAREPWNDVWVSSRTVEVPPGGSRSVRATLVVPDGQPSGVYQGFVRVSSVDGGRLVDDPPAGSSSPPPPPPPGSPGRPVPFVADVPVSYAVAEPVAGPGRVAVGGLHGAGPAAAAAGLHDPSAAAGHLLDGSGLVRGAFDMTGRYMSGDWRAVYFDVADPSIDTMVVDIAWDDPGTSLTAFAAGPDGRIISSSAGAGAFAELLGWPSSDWLGPDAVQRGRRVLPRGSQAAVVDGPARAGQRHGGVHRAAALGAVRRRRGRRIRADLDRGRVPRPAGAPRPALAWPRGPAGAPRHASSAPALAPPRGGGGDGEGMQAAGAAGPCLPASSTWRGPPATPLRKAAQRVPAARAGRPAAAFAAIPNFRFITKQAVFSHECKSGWRVPQGRAGCPGATF